MSKAIYSDFLGTWILIPESCVYEQGAPPQQGRYTIAEEAHELVFAIAWTDAAGKSHEVSFRGVPDGKPVAFAGGPLADALSIEAPSPTRLLSSAFKAGELLMAAERQLDDTKTAMRVVQQVRLPDGTRPTNVSMYRKVLAN